MGSGIWYAHALLSDKLCLSFYRPYSDDQHYGTANMYHQQCQSGDGFARYSVLYIFGSPGDAYG